MHAINNSLPQTAILKNCCFFSSVSVEDFTIKCDGLVGALTKIHIEHDNSGWGAGWYLEKVGEK